MADREAIWRATIDPHTDRVGGLIRAMHALVALDGYLDPASYPLLAECFNLSRAEINHAWVGLDLHHCFLRSSRLSRAACDVGGDTRGNCWFRSPSFRRVLPRLARTQPRHAPR